jgi:GAF domain-containing protein/signal transduction histidine kinase
MQQSSTRTEYEKRQLAFYRYLRELQKQESIEGMGSVLLNFLQEWFQFDLIWIAQYKAQDRVLNGLNGMLPTERDAAVLRRKQPLLPGDWFDQVLLTGNLQEIPNLKQEQRVGDWQTVAQHHNIQGTIILPIRYRHRSFGVILVGTTLWGGHPRPEEMTELKMLAVTFGAELYQLLGNTAPLPTQQTSQPSVETLTQILAADTFEERLQLVLGQIHYAIQPARTCLYWFNAETQTCRLHETYTDPQPRRSAAKVPAPKLEIPIQAIASFYESSLQNQTVAIADIQGFVNNNQAPTRLMTMTRSRAWLSASILDRGRLVAVLAVEDNEPRLWTDSDRQSLQLMAQLMAHGKKDSIGNDTSAPKKGEHFGLNGLLSVLKDTYSDTEPWNQTLLQCLEQIGIQFSVRWAAVMTHHPESQDFRCRAQFFHKKKHQPLTDRLPELSAVDAKMLARMSGSIAIQSLTEDLRLMAWRQPLMDRGVKSLLLLKLDPHAKAANLGSFLLLATELSRTWTPQEMESVTPVAEQLGQALSQRDQWQQDALQVQFLTALNQGLQSIQLTPPGDALFVATAQALHTLLEVECVMILRWLPDQPEGAVAALINHSKFQVEPQAPILWQTDAFLQRIIAQTTDVQPTGVNSPSAATLPHLWTEQGSLEALTIEASGWLSGMGRVDLLAVPLKIYPEDPCLGLVLILDSRRQYWTDLKREGIQLLTRELTAHHRAHSLLERLNQKQVTLECLNWYKQRHLEYVSKLWTAQMSKFQAVFSEKVLAASQGSRSRGGNSVGTLYSALSSLETILKGEVWDLQLEPESIPVATLFRRTLERIEEVARTRQLWTQVHNLTPSVSLCVPVQKIELMLVELLLAACYRSKTGDRIDIWCRALPEQWVEISITDNGRMNPLLIQAIQHPAIQIPLAASILETLPGRHFKICQSLVERLGGQLELAQLEDGRAMSRLLLPIAPAPQR